MLAALWETVAETHQDSTTYLGEVDNVPKRKVGEGSSEQEVERLGQEDQSVNLSGSRT